jgi:two-component system alkaline phosphatase synthesis response regulator PhoP
MSSKILIVDDSALVLAMASDALKAAGYEVFTAANGIEANSYIYSTTNKPDLIILDIMMPLLDGNKISKILKQQNHSQDIPIVFISSKSEAELVSLVQEAGADGYICKPFTPQSIVTCVRKVLK